LRVTERFIAGLYTLFVKPARVLRSAIVLKPSTLLHLHHVLAKRKYHMLLSPQGRRPPGPKGPHRELIDAVATDSCVSFREFTSSVCFLTATTHSTTVEGVS
jgi:hypothetical protein